MTIEKAYLKFLQEVNKNLTNQNISVDKPRFILQFNKAQNQFQNYNLDKRNEDDIRILQQVVVTDRELKKTSEHTQFDSYALPEDYFDFADVRATFSTDSCSGDLKVFEIKTENTSELYNDEFSKPSIIYRETFARVGGGSVNIYKDSFNLESAFLTYYRFPKQVDIVGYTKEDGRPSESIDPEWNDAIVETILSIAAVNYNVDNGTPQIAPLQRERIIRNI